MNPLAFPDPHKEMERRCAEFQRLSVDERIRQIVALMALGWSLVRASPRRAEIEKKMQEDEAEWRRIQRELFARHGA